ncbi:MAG: thioesterase family protein [Acidimicrobiales bacterium]|nr:thioesterase family protein [Acidimicrobiales bacterium]
MGPPYGAAARCADDPFGRAARRPAAGTVARVALALYLPDGDRLVPTELTGGPWSPEAQHGGAVAALLARAVEAVPAPVAMQTLRLTVELLRPVPLRPLQTLTTVLRPGKRVQLVEASVMEGETEVARARALRIRSAPVPVPDQPELLDYGPEPAAGAPLSIEGHLEHASFLRAVDFRFVRGSGDTVGPATAWARLRVPVVPGEEPSPLQRTAAVADFGNGISRVLDFSTHTFINPDLTVSLSRPPVGEWVGLDMVTRLSPDGYGQAESLVFDRLGPVGRAVQSLIIDRRSREGP